MKAKIGRSLDVLDAGSIFGDVLWMFWMRDQDLGTFFGCFGCGIQDFIVCFFCLRTKQKDMSEKRTRRRREGEGQ